MMKNYSENLQPTSLTNFQNPNFTQNYFSPSIQEYHSPYVVEPRVISYASLLRTPTQLKEGFEKLLNKPTISSEKQFLILCAELSLIPYLRIGEFYIDSRTTESLLTSRVTDVRVANAIKDLMKEMGFPPSQMHVAPNNIIAINNQTFANKEMIEADKKNIENVLLNHASDYISHPKHFMGPRTGFWALKEGYHLLKEKYDRPTADVYLASDRSFESKMLLQQGFFPYSREKIVDIYVTALTKAGHLRPTVSPALIKEDIQHHLNAPSQSIGQMMR